MKIWKVFSLITGITILTPPFLYSQVSKPQELTYLMGNGHYFESKKLYQELGDTIAPEIDSFYKFRMAQFANKQDSATAYIEKMLTDYPNIFHVETINVYAELFETYSNLETYEKCLYTYKRMKQHLKDNPYALDRKTVKNWEKYIEKSLENARKLKDRPSIKLKRKDSNDFVRIEGDSTFTFEAKYNGVSQKSLFDTGIESHILMKKEMANKLGLKSKKTFQKTKKYINGIEMVGNVILVDSIEIGNITLYNVPALIYEYDITTNLPDSIKKDSLLSLEGFNKGVDFFTNPFIGLPAMFMIGKIKINWIDKTFSFSTEKVELPLSREQNMYLFNKSLYTCLSLNNIPFTAHFDTGSDSYIDIDTLFYENHRDNIPIDTLTTKSPLNHLMAHKTWCNIPYEIPDNLTCAFNNKPIIFPKKESIKIYSMKSIWPEKFFDGIVGYAFLKNIGREVLLDFDNMRIEAIK